jgi:hypothetical protein
MKPHVRAGGEVEVRNERETTDGRRQMDAPTHLTCVRLGGCSRNRSWSVAHTTICLPPPGLARWLHLLVPICVCFGEGTGREWRKEEA